MGLISNTNTIEPNSTILLVYGLSLLLLPFLAVVIIYLPSLFIVKVKIKIEIRIPTFNSKVLTFLKVKSQYYQKIKQSSLQVYRC